MSNNVIRIGTRRSRLALWQSNFIAERLKSDWPGLEIKIIHIVTKGDLSQEKNIPLPEIGGKGLFTAELEQGLKNNEIDLAVHSCKDLPTEEQEEFIIAATPRRAAANDVLIGMKLGELPQGAVVGTSSVRRASQLKRIRPDVQTVDIRGNVETRIKKQRDPANGMQAIMLAQAGLDRLGLSSEVSEIMNFEDMLPAPAQGVLAVQTRRDDTRTRDLLHKLHDANTFQAASCERAFLAELQAGCNTPVGAFARIEGDKVFFRGRCLSPDGRVTVDVEGEGAASEAVELGTQWARQALARGARDLIGFQ